MLTPLEDLFKAWVALWKDPPPAKPEPLCKLVIELDNERELTGLDLIRSKDQRVHKLD